MPFVRFRRRVPDPPRATSTDERRFALGTRSPADLVAPAAVEVTRDHLRLDNQYTRTLMVTGYPRTVNAGWLSPLIDFEEPLEISLHLHPLDSARMAATLTHQMVRLHSSRLLAARGGRLADPEREVAYEDAERLRDDLQRGDERIFSVGLYVLLRAGSLTELDTLTRRVEATLDGLLAQSRVALLEQDGAFRACLPEGRDALLAHRNLDTSSLATMFPFSSRALSMERGVLYGVARHNHSPVIVDPFDAGLENANLVVFAKSGAGKSYFTKLMAMRTLLADVDFLVIDPEDEYRRLCAAVGGQYVRLAGTSAQRLNPFDLPAPPPGLSPERFVGNSVGHPDGARSQADRAGATDRAGRAPADEDEDEAQDALAEQVTALVALLEIMVATPEAPLGAHERAILDRALYVTYAAAGITKDPATHGRPAPLLRDLYAVLQGAATGDAVASGLVARLHRYAEGSLAGLFAGPTNVALDRPFVVFNIQRLEPELRPLAIHVVTAFVWAQVRRARRPRLLVVDEAWSVLQYREGGAFLAGLARRARKYYLGLVTISQSVTDFLGCDQGRTVLANAAVKLLMKQDSTTIDRVVDAFRLSAEERQFLLAAGKGEGLLFARGSRVALQVEASPAEHRLATTSPRELAALERPAAAAGASQPNGAAHPIACPAGPRRRLGALPEEERGDS